ncbi:hypothetical protein OIU34_21760 [Pararhizobium sp. BT-229]|uniref:hypothetical protein n=1 Tax=Pararhizobium sp. BT-229 TaxID=2986923 RepID=UPI0021F70624|nr:hypothetical protein [Pararhizobium sp. BT-229]MCV9964520.1 hypothetical protein [Pararhizobium sp. BT-229]
MESIQDYLRRCARSEFERDRKPVVAMDCIAAKAHGELLEKLATKVDGMDDQAALSYLVTLRDNNRNSDQEYRTTMDMVFSFSSLKWFDGIVDRVSREQVGWIVVNSTGFDGKHNLNLPAYRRMLGINHGVAYIARGKGETDDAWLLRRAEWLSAYHPEVEVVHGSSLGEKKISLGTVGTFMLQEHLVEAGLAAVRAWDVGDGVVFEKVEHFLAPRHDGVIATVKQVKGEQRPLGIIKLHDYLVELVA